jgi:BirA family biotin operon repressor/biotin-[acetyl-CoA-carboxylase] ligase
LTSNLWGDPLPREFADAIEQARDRLGPIGSRVAFFSTVGSTNDVASTLAAASSHEGTVVIADSQTAGRGRLGRTWFSPPGNGLYVSVVLRLSRAGRDVDRAAKLVTIAAGAALAEAIAAATALGVAVKWPNDLYVGRRKLGGILAEAAMTASSAAGIDTVIVGYGINVGSMAYPPELGDRATSLEIELGRPVDRAFLLAETLAAVARRHDDLLAGRFDAILDAWRARAPGSRGSRVSWSTPSGTRTGTTSGIDEQGALLVQVGDDVERIVAGEITWL